MASIKIFNYKKYEARTLFEISVGVEQVEYLLIYGKHINGYFCAIPNHGISCEMTIPDDVYYNYEKLTKAGIKEEVAKVLAKIIKEVFVLLDMKISPEEQMKESVENLRRAMSAENKEVKISID